MSCAGQPILGFIYGAKKYRRVTDTYFATLRYALIVLLLFLPLIFGIDGVL